MPDIAVEYELTTPSGVIIFNDGSADQYYITEIQGLAGTPLRTPIDSAPQAHGGLVHNFWKGPRAIVVEGVLLITSVPLGRQCQAIRNQMEMDLVDALESILQTDGVLVWTPTGLSSHTLYVRYSQTVEFAHAENYLLRAFNFGLVAADPDPYLST